MLLSLLILPALFGVPLPLVVVAGRALLYLGNLLDALVVVAKRFDRKMLLLVAKVVAVIVRRANKAEELETTEREAMTPRSNNFVQYDDDGSILLLKLIRFSVSSYSVTVSCWAKKVR